MAIPYMEVVSSSNVSAVGYDSLENTLYVEFNISYIEKKGNYNERHLYYQ